ncbi:N-6 DNA methylase [Patescibacteria group bacterium]|nr:N-6 DNA methylase [Patescibacteria group bacterium]
MRRTITERSLYPELSRLLEANGFENISDIGVRHGYFDFECFYKSKRFIVEIKIGTGRYSKNLLRGVTQAWGYCQDVKGDGILVIEYPAQVRTPLFIKPDIVRDIATETKVNAIVLSHFFNESFTSIKPSEVFSKLRFSIDDFLVTKETKTSFKLVIEVLRTGIGVISEILRAQRTKKEISELIETVVGRFDLFLGLGQIEKTKKATEELQLTAIDLIPYLLSNQILFYRIFSETTGKIEKLEENKITSIQALKDYFKKVTDINYKAIYSVDLVSKLPDQKEIVEEVREIIKAINILKPEFVKHDLLGRLYHELLPPTTRKILAAFYTNPVAADILAELTIDKWDTTVIDPACGSGTLLVAAYKRKLDLYKEKREIDSFLELEKLHKKFIEQQITGIDIMPFASHLTAVNLAAQTPNAVTNKVRVGCQDSLELQNRLILPEFTKGPGTSIEPFRVPTQKAIQVFGEEVVLDRSGAIGPEGEKGEKFSLKPVDVVLMNPPFSDRNKLPKQYREHLKDFQHLITKCGNRINFWGFFLALVDYLLKENGKMGLVIPINIARGKATQEIRNYILENYHIHYMLKTTEDIAFSEGSAFRDILLIAEKRKPKARDLTGIVFLKRSIKEMSTEDGERITKKIKSISKNQSTYSDEDIELRFINYKKFLDYRENFMPLIGGVSQNNMEILRVFVERSIKNEDKLTNLKSDMLKEGITSPEGLGQLVYITNPLDESRLKRAFIVFEREEPKKIYAAIKDTKFKLKIPKQDIKPLLRTLTGIKKIDIAKQHDFVTTCEYSDFKKVLAISKWKKKKFDWKVIQKKVENLGLSRLVVPDKINLSSKNTHLIALFSEEPLVLSNLFFAFSNLDKNDCKIYTLSLNSILCLSQFIIYKPETLGTYIRMSAHDWELTKQINPRSVSEKEKETLMNLFEKLKDVEFPSIIEQLENRFPARIELDKKILKILGFSDKEIDEWLPKIYDILVKELKAMKEI